ncbi:hypothetical protein BP6252_00624 [Coleophoma cylindrospora]|uniref:Cyclin-like protein n=1 Tax=Coleophoma cylindrospora TaxID=1849047 RepID=A0A3D8SQM7_9HELO|nr:hypothetical protein BP6252_00624 [Coleophoma cylindrospora]
MHRNSARSAPLDFLLPSHTIPGFGGRKDIKPPLSLSHLNPTYFEAPIRDGLRTPPADEMGSIYQPPPYHTYAGRQEPTYPAASAAIANTYVPPTTYTAPSSQSRLYSSQNSYPQSVSQNASIQSEAPSISHTYSRPTSPRQSSRTESLAPPEGLPRRKSVTSDLILPNLQIPTSVNNSGGSLAEFAAQITCLFWFESTETLKKAEGITPSSSPIQRLKEEALPSSGFRKWVVTILSTTQVTQNVILLALLFIYRLKTINPGVKGRSGSEYRLLTVALMLGNKFLDDNTYTNKTWAEVSGISVTEIHVMEVEFLSNMRYSLLASKEQWEEWQTKLGKFWTYCDQASRAPVNLPSPLSGPISHAALPSPPASMQSSPPSLASTYTTTPYTQNLQYPSTSSSNNYAPPLVSPLPAMPDLRATARKRSYDHEAEEPVAKRVTRSTANAPSAAPQARHDLPRLPVPNLTVSTSQPMNNGHYDARAFAQNVPLLPPLSGRAMSTVFPTTPTWTPQLPMLTPTGPSNGNQHGSQSANGYGTPSRRQSPHSVQELLSLRSSPTSANFSAHNLGHISPSFFLQHRSSPYKPVRHVNTLLYPPPSASMHDYSANVEHMHYQPLGKRNDYRAGVVPDYTAHPHYQNWPVLPQPNFNA